MSVGNVKQAERILKAYAEDLKGLTMWECIKTGFSLFQCYTLVKALGKGAKGEVTADEQRQLDEKGFAKEFIQKIAGEDGRNALRLRGRWFANRCNFVTYALDCRSDALKNDEVPALIEVLKDGDWDVMRTKAVMALGEIEDTRAVPALTEALKDSSKYVRGNAGGALGKIQDARAVPSLIEAMKDDYWNARGNAAWALGEIGRAHGVGTVAPAISELRRIANMDPNQYVRSQAKWALEELMGEMR